MIVLFCACTWIGIQHLGYLEFGVAGRMFMDGAFRRLLNSQICLRTYEEQLIAAATPEECWSVIEAACREFGFHRAYLSLAGRHSEYVAEIEPIDAWQARIPVSDHDFINLTRSFGTGAQSNVIAPLADMLRHTLAPKLPIFARLPAASHRPPKVLAVSSTQGD